MGIVIRLLLPLLVLLPLFVEATPWNSPYPKGETADNTLFSAFSSPPKHLDPLLSYSSNEWAILSQIYEPPLQYHYLKRPYTLEPLTLTEMPRITYLDAHGKQVDANSSAVAFSEYHLELRSDIYYQNHPAFVKDTTGQLRYGHLSVEALEGIESVEDFAQMATRRLVAEDYAYAIKRMAVRQNHSPILDSMQAYIVGLERFSEAITQIAHAKRALGEVLDLRGYAIEGVKVEDERHLSVRIKGRYPQFLYWLSMNFFAPIPWEADCFYQQAGLIAKNLTLDSWPVGTGAYYLVTHNPSQTLRLRANPNFHSAYYPTLTPQEAEQMGIPTTMLTDGGKRLPFIQEVVYTLEKERIPLWSKFLQGYYDASAVSAESFNQAVSISASGRMGLSASMRQQGITLKSAIEPSIFYLAFNMADPVVGGYTPQARKLRQAISIAQDQEEYISIFMNERGIPAQGPLPAGIFGHLAGKEGTNPIVYRWEGGRRVRRTLEEAKRLLAEAGYPEGISAKSGKPLTLYYDTTSTGADGRALMDWRRKQFAKLGIVLVIRTSDYNRFQEKVRQGTTQLFSWGWNADYPDPENFLFLLYGGNATIDTNGTGINSSNYKNPQFDRLFEQMKRMPNSPKRLAIIRQMLDIVRADAPWVWGVHPKSLTLTHRWYHNLLPHAMANNTLKYRRIDASLRVTKQTEWNPPVLLPLLLLLLVVLLGLRWLYRSYEKREQSTLQGDH